MRRCREHFHFPEELMKCWEDKSKNPKKEKQKNAQHATKVDEGLLMFECSIVCLSSRTLGQLLLSCIERPSLGRKAKR